MSESEIGEASQPGETSEPESPPKLDPEALEPGYTLRGETRTVDLTNGRWLVLELGNPENQVIIGLKKPGNPDAVGGPIHDARDGIPFVCVGPAGSGESERTVEIPATHPLPLGRQFQPERFSDRADQVHALIRRRDKTVIIEDLDSKNGTTVRYQN